jgi:hypothetical protein
MILKNEISGHSIGIALTTNGRCVPLLRFITNEWLRLRAELIIATNGETRDALRDLPITIVTTDVSPARHGDAMQEAFDRVRSPFVLTGADDRLPVGPGWMADLPRIPRSIAAVKLIDVVGKRHYDWATWSAEKGSWPQPYDMHASNTYITGGAQLISPEVRSVVSYRNRPFRSAGDVHYCLEAAAAGFDLIPPNEHTPIMIHLDR